MQVRQTEKRYHHLSAFDLDRTLVGKTASVLFFQELIKRGIYPKSSYLKALYYQLSHQYLNLSLFKLHHHLFEAFLIGKNLEEFRKLADAFIDENIEKLIHPPTLLRLRHAQHMGHYTVILSNSPDFIVEPIAKALGVDSFKATCYACQDGKFSSIHEVMECENKAKHLDKLLQELTLTREAVTTYSDSILDLPFLIKSPSPIAVNPDRKLRKIFLQHGWEIL